MELKKLAELQRLLVKAPAVVRLYVATQACTFFDKEKKTAAEELKERFKSEINKVTEFGKRTVGTDLGFAIEYSYGDGGARLNEGALRDALREEGLKAKAIDRVIEAAKVPVTRSSVRAVPLAVNVPGVAA